MEDLINNDDIFIHSIEDDKHLGISKYGFPIYTVESSTHYIMNKEGEIIKFFNIYDLDR